MQTTTRCSCALFLVIIFPFALVSSEWTQYRGENGRGETAEVLPIHWGENRNIAWKIEIPGRGWSSPVISDGMVWVTTATEEGHSLRAVAVDIETGKIRWDIEAFQPRSPDPVNALNSWATPTPVAETGRVYVSFGNMGNAGIDSKRGVVLWRNNDLHLDHKEGAASSPVLWKNLFILECDGTDSQFVTALDKNTGGVVWKTQRSADLLSIRFDLRKAYSTPTVTEIAGRPVLLSAGSRRFYAYDVRTGVELWYVDHPGYNNTQPALVEGDCIYWGTGWNRAELYAVRIDNTAIGNITASHIVWKTNRRVPKMPSILSLGDRLLMLTENGFVSTVSVDTGNEVWSKKVLGKCYASPLLSKNGIYIFDSMGKALVLAREHPHDTVAENDLESGCMASPAVWNQSLIVRTKTHLYRIADKGE